MKQRFRKKKSEEKEIALERIKELFNQADEVVSEDQKLAKRYVTLAKNISTRIKVQIPKELKRRYCKNCLSYLKPGLNARIRLNNGKKTYFCMACQTFTRIPYK